MSPSRCLARSTRQEPLSLVHSVPLTPVPAGLRLLVPVRTPAVRCLLGDEENKGAWCQESKQNRTTMESDPANGSDRSGSTQRARRDDRHGP
jgi:hypothetical protein